MPPNPPSNSRLPRLAVWSGYGTETTAKQIPVLADREFFSFFVVFFLFCICYVALTQMLKKN